MTDDVVTMGVGDCDLGVQACNGGLVELTLTDGLTELAGQLDLDDVRRLIEVLQQAAAEAEELQR